LPDHPDGAPGPRDPAERLETAGRRPGPLHHRKGEPDARGHQRPASVERRRREEVLREKRRRHRRRRRRRLLSIAA
jgi:hypothetical protein